MDNLEKLIHDANKKVVKDPPEANDQLQDAPPSGSIEKLVSDANKKSTNFNQNIVGHNTGIGDSKFDKELLPNLQLNPETFQEDLEDFRSKKQSDLEKAGKGLARVANKIGVELAKIPGYLVGGVAGALGEGAQFFDGQERAGMDTFVNNWWIKGIEQYEEYVNSEILPVYVKKSVKEGNLWDNISSIDFWATEGADGLAFMLSMIIPGAAISKAGLGSKLLSLTGKGSKGAEGIDFLSKVGRTSKLLGVKSKADGIDLITSTMVNTVFEAGSEANGAMKAARERLRHKYEEGLITEKEYNNEAARVGSEVFKSNMGILLLPNLILNKQLLNLGKQSKRASKFKIANGEIASNVEKKTYKQLAWDYGGKIIGSNTLREGFFEEGLQSTVEKYWQHNKEFNAKELMNTYMDVVSSTEGQKAVFLGGLFGSFAGSVGQYNKNKGNKERDNAIIEAMNSSINFYESSLEGFIKKDENGEPLIIDSKVQHDFSKLKDHAESIENIKELEGRLDLASTKEQYEILKDRIETNILAPFLKAGEDGLTILKERLKDSESFDQSIEDNNTLNPNNHTSRENAISNLEAKFNDLLQDTNYYENYGSNINKVKVNKENKEVYKSFQNKLKNVFINTRSQQRKVDSLITQLEADRVSLKDVYKNDSNPIIKNVDKKLKQLNDYKDTLTNQINDILDSSKQEQAFNNELKIAEDITKFEEESVIEDEKIKKETEAAETESAIKEDLKKESEEETADVEAKGQSNKTYSALEELINNRDNYELEPIPGSPGVIAKGISDLHLPILQGLPGFEDLKGNDAIIIEPIGNGDKIKVAIQKASSPTSIIEFEVDKFNLTETKEDKPNNSVEDVTNNDKPLKTEDNAKESIRFQKEQEKSTNPKAKDASIVNAKGDYTSDNYEEYAENPRNKTGEEVTFEIGINSNTNSDNNQSKIDAINKRREKERIEDKKRIVKQTDTKYVDSVLDESLEGYVQIGIDLTKEQKRQGIANDIELFVENNNHSTEQDYKDYKKTQGHTYWNYLYINNPRVLKEYVTLYSNLMKARNRRDAKYDAEIAALENNNSNGNTVLSVTAQDAIELFNSVIRGDITLTDEHLQILIKNLPIKVNLAEDAFSHLPFESEKSNLELTDAEYTLRENIISQALANKSFEGITSTIKFQYPGIVKQDSVDRKPAQNNILELPTINNDISKVEFYISNGNGDILNLNNEPTAGFGRSSNPGSIFIKIPTANGKDFPLKLNIRRVNKPETDLVLRVTEALLDPSKPIKFTNTFNSIMDNFEFTEQELQSLNQEAKILGKDLKSLKVIELLSSIVFEGNSTKNKFKVSRDTLTYGDNTVTFEEFNNNKEAVSNWLQSNKNRNVKKAKLKEKIYKEFMSNNVLSTNAKLGEATFGGNTKIYLDPKIKNKVDPSLDFASSGNDFNRFLDTAEQEEGQTQVKPDIKDIPNATARKNIKNKVKKGSKAALKARAAKKKNNSDVNDIPSTNDKNKKC